MRQGVIDKLLKLKVYLISGLIISLCSYCFSKSATASHLYKINNILLSGGGALTKADDKSSIPIHFRLLEPGYVTLIIEDMAGVRVRNLVSETWFPAGDNTVWWDGSNDWRRDADAANRGIYSIPVSLVGPGKYRVRGIVRKAITAHYEFSTYYAGSPPWSTVDHTGAWLANHTPPQAAAYLPGKLSPGGKPLVLLGCYVTEGPDGLAWVDLDGKKKGGKKWIGGAWTSAPFIAVDNGDKSTLGNSAYVAAVWTSGTSTNQFELRLNSLSVYKNDFKIVQVGKYSMGTYSKSDLPDLVNGLAVYNDIAVVTSYKKNQLLIIDTKAGGLVASVNVDKPRGIMIDSLGRVMLCSGNKLIGFKSIADLKNGVAPQLIISNGLDDPYAVTKDIKGNIYISDRGNSNNVKVFDAKGGFVKSIGFPGPLKAGAYNPLHMNNPAGITIDEKQQLWVTEQDYLPKRVSVWNLNGQLIKAFYGPAKYGGGGTIDPIDKNKSYYSEGDKGTMEFALDWARASWKVSNIIYRPKTGDLKLATNSAAPETPIYLNGKRYFTNCYTANPTNGVTTAFLFIDRNGVIVPVAAMGRVSNWDILKGKEFKKSLPANASIDTAVRNDETFFIWQDSNSDGQVEPQEVVFQQGYSFGITVMADLSFCVANLNDEVVKYSPVSFSKDGIPLYQLNKVTKLGENVLKPASSGGGQVLSGPDGWSVVTLGIKPFSQLSVSGTKDGKVMWSYPDLWPGLHASHRAPVPEHPGELIGTTRLLGDFIKFKDSAIPRLWFVNGNHGNVYAFTDDGLFVSTLFKDKNSASHWDMNAATRNMLLDSITLNEENFYPTITKSDDENVYMIDGFRSSIVRLDGLETIRRLPDTYIDVTTADLQRRNINMLAAAVNQSQVQSNILQVSILRVKPNVDGNLDEWNKLPWIQVDNRGFSTKKANLPFYDVSATLGVYKDRLYGMYCTGEKDLLQNSGEMPLAPFKTGGALDIMIGSSDRVDTNRTKPVKGDCRLLITIIDNQPKALLYRAVVPGTAANARVPFSSPSNTITFDKVDDVSSQIEFAFKDGSYEFSIPLAIIGLKPVDGLRIKGDIGILRGKDGQTISRLYWNNKATGLTSDVPSEAMLTPGLWGTFVFKN